MKFIDIALKSVDPALNLDFSSYEVIIADKCFYGR